MLDRRGFAIAVVAFMSAAHAQEPLTADQIARADAAIRSAFAFLYALPPDTQGARMGTWVLDTSATRHDEDDITRWHIVATKLTDTGKGLELKDMVGDPGTSPAQLAASMAAMQRLEGKISKAEADTALEVLVAVNEDELAVAGVSDDAARSKPVVPGSQLAVRLRGDWMKFDDRELEVDYERWSPATLLVGFGPFGPIETTRRVAKESLATFAAKLRTGARPGIRSVAVTVQGNEEMIDRVVKETNWSALAALIK